MKRWLLFVLLLLSLGGCRENSPASGNTPPNQEALTISAAVSLKDAFNEIAGLYKAETGRGVNFNFGASGALQRQIETGAPVDVFASAGARQMDELAGKSLVETATRRDFARNALVLIVPPDSRINLTNFSELNQQEVQKIAVGNPKTVPAGQYTEQLFEKMNLKSVLQPKLILAEDVRQVLDYVVRGETDAGVVYATDAQIAGGKIRVAATASEDSHDPILYPIAVVKDSKQKEAAQRFLDLVLSPEGQNIFRKYGFTTALK
jgi:molybdate transport system substrate-binding protein